MRAILLEDVGKLTCRQVPEPEPKRDEVKIQVVCCGICGSDLHCYHGMLPLAYQPLIMGHEFSGTVCAVGSEVTRFKIGDRVTAQPFRTGEEICIVGVHCDGAMAEYVCMEEKYTFKLPDCVSFADATLIEPACVSAHAVLDFGDLKPADVVAVIGAGPIGLMAAIIAKACGAHVVLIGRSTSADRLKIGKSLGVDETLMSDRDDVPGKIMALTGGKGAKAVFETGGTDESIAQAISLLGIGGKLVALALTPLTGTTIANFSDLVQKEITLQASNCSLLENWPKVIALLESGRIRFDGIVTKEYAFEDCDAAFRTKAMKNVLCTSI